MRIPVDVTNNIGARTETYTGCGTFYGVVETLSGVLYSFFINLSNTDPSYSKSLNNGRTWSNPVALKACSGTNIAVWYDRWSGINADLIHVVYTDSLSDDTFYRNLDTSTDTLSSEKVVFAGESTATGGGLSITRARGGNLIVATCIDAGVEYDTVKSTDVGVNWSSISEVWEGETQDQVILMPGFATDDQDVIAIFWDASADEISRKLYDDSADSWAETSISGGMVDAYPSINNSGYPNFAAAPDLTNSQLFLVAWNGVDTANQDLKCWTITESTITAKTDIVTNAVDDCAYCALQLINNILYCFYAGNQDGSSSYLTALPIMVKSSLDYGSTWTSQGVYELDNSYLMSITSPPISYVKLNLCEFRLGNALSYLYNAIEPRATSLIGI